MNSSQTQTPIRKRRRPSRTDADALHTLYRFYDCDGLLLYIGITGDPRARWSKHSKTKSEWRRVDTVKVQHCNSREELEAAERAAIMAERPLWNKVHNRPAYPMRTLAEVRAMLDVSDWLTLADVAVLFGVAADRAERWIVRGSPLLGFRKPETRVVCELTEVDPGWVAELLLESRKVRSGEYPDGIPGAFQDPNHWLVPSTLRL